MALTRRDIRETIGMLRVHIAEDNRIDEGTRRRARRLITKLRAI